MDVVTKSAKETQELGEKVGNRLTSNDSAVVLALSGDLGSGKTTFVQGLAKGLGVISRIISPTFILMRSYGMSKGNLYHIDLYRLEGNVSGELANLGFSEIVSDPRNIVVVEWAEKAKESMPRGTHWIEFESLEIDDRKIVLPKELRIQ